MHDIEVELVFGGSVDLYLSDSVAEFVMSSRTWDSDAQENVFPAANTLKLWIDYGLKDALILEEEAEGLHSLEIEGGKIIGFFSGNQDFIGVGYHKYKSSKPSKIPVAKLKSVSRIKINNKWRQR